MVIVSHKTGSNTFKLDFFYATAEEKRQITGRATLEDASDAIARIKPGYTKEETEFVMTLAAAMARPQSCCDVIFVVNNVRLNNFYEFDRMVRGI